MTSTDKTLTEVIEEHWPGIIAPQGSVVSIGVHAGWWPQLWGVCRAISAHNKRAETNADLYPCLIVQIKEKFGGLRFYTSSEPKAIGVAIQAAEDACSVTCERCGMPADLDTSSGWWKTLCAKCAVSND
jgi:hypothetical protein